MLFDYEEFLEEIDKEAYHAGEWQWQEGDYTVTRTYHYSAPGCHDSCGLLAYTKDDKLVKVEGDPLDPCVNGKLCMRCLNLVENVNHDERVKYPMKRVGKRGENSWERISWDDAAALIKEEVQKLEDKGYGHESIFVSNGTGRNTVWQVPLIAAALKTPNVGAINLAGQSCYGPRIYGTFATLGDYIVVDTSQCSEQRYNDPEWVNPDVLVVWGNEPLKSNADGFIGHWLLPSMQMGTKVISIDPVLTWWSARAEFWLPIRPGTDEALALAWLHVITQEDLIDHEFVDCWCAYYDALKEHVAQYTPEWAAEICGLDVDEIIGSARLYATAKRGAIQWGLAFDTQVSAMELCMSVTDLLAICGNIDRPGTTMIVRNAFNIDAGESTSDIFCGTTFNKKLTASTLGCEGMEFCGSVDSDAVNIAMESGEPYPIKMMWVQSSNALACMAFDAPRTYEAVKNTVDFCVVADPFMTPSAVAFADLVLPVAMSIERDSARTWWTPLRTMKKVATYYEAKSDEEIVVWLGNLLHPEVFKRWPTALDLINDYMSTALAIIDENGNAIKPGFDLSADLGSDARSTADVHTDFNLSDPSLTPFDDVTINDCGYRFWDWNNTYEKYEKGMLRPDGEKGFNTPSGRLELIPYSYTVWGIDPYPSHKENKQSMQWIEDASFREEYPFYFVNGARSYEFFHSEQRQCKTMREFHPEPLVKISPKTAEEYELVDGEWIWIENTSGRCKQKVQIFPGLKDWVISAEHGWWFPEQEAAEPSLFGTFDSNPNNLTHVYETGSHNIGAPRKNVCCKIYKIKEGDTLPGKQVTELGGFRTYVNRES